MTRLINADAIEYHMMAKEDWLGNTVEDSKMVWKADIDSMPTVDAVPVSFIFDKMRTINSEYINIQRLIDTEPETAVKRIGIATNLLCEYNAFQNLIREWAERKEE